DIWGNDLANDTYEKAENTEDNDSIEKMPFITDFDSTAKAQALPHINNLLPNDKDYDIMYLSDDADSAGTTSSGQTNQNASESESSTTFVTYGYPDENVVGGIQLRLNELGYTGVDITGVFDLKTEAGIRKFQEKRGLPVTGVLDDATKAEMGFSEDYSVSRKGKNATMGHAPYSPPFNMDAYKRAQERLKREKEEALKVKEEDENFSLLARLLNLPLYVLSLILGEDAVSGMNPGTEVAEDPLQEEDLWENGTMNDYNN
ncbi:MAG: peptidoglycan-binding domain-containing protein, partial [Clostridia bacterium]|nr:peptidoglycan-binding domain-containing protein [Clostridia bacterium]